jgi:hypothetical protein
MWLTDSRRRRLSTSISSEVELDEEELREFGLNEERESEE